MKSRPANKRLKLSQRISEAIAAERPLKELAGNLSYLAKSALAEANSLSVERVEIKIAKLPKKLDGLRIVHLSDIHHSPFTSLEHINRAIEAANRLKPQLVLLTGDYVSHDRIYISPVAKALGELRSEFGTYACLGNHDHWTDPGDVTAQFGDHGIDVLINRGFRLDAGGASFWLCGVDDYMVGKSDLKSALHGSFPDEMKLLLAHNPVLVRHAARRGIDLVLSGHTHGGQVKLRQDENRILPKRRLSAGLHRRKETQIYITRGIGTVVVPFRYQCPPEISVIELRST
ncbi:MAG TPA: metallophosphoesterase [Pyrinomonadaceae bacterium]|nr:metallophosphoesterase [Pyrinomonadaceae bacterium]